MTDRPSQREVSARFKVQRIEEARARKAKLEADLGPQSRGPAKTRGKANGAPPPGDDRPHLPYKPHELHVAVAGAVDVLGGTPNVFERGGSLVRVAGGLEGDELVRPAAVLERHTQDEDALEVLRRSPRVVPFTTATLRSLLTSRLVVVTEVADSESASGRKWVPRGPPDDLVKAILEAGAWEGGIHTLEGLSETAFLRPDGTLATSAGFDRSTGYYLAPGCAFLHVPDAPTQTDAAAALLELEEVFVDFPHVSRSHRMVPIAAILTLLARPGLMGNNVPAFVLDAATRGTGKSLQSDAVAIVGTGRASSKMSWPPDPAELEKVLGAFALQGAALVNFDNVASGFGGASLDKCLTAGGRVSLRVLGKTEAPDLPWRAIVIASGNNVVLVGDMSRRALVSRVESPLENPEDRTDFQHPDLLAWVTEHRARLVRAALTILRGFVVAGRPSQGLRAWGSFEAWSALVPAALVWAGGADLMACRPEVSGTIEPEKAALLAVLADWPRLTAGEPTTAKRVIDALYPADRMRGGAPDGFEDLRGAIEEITNAKPGFPPTPKSFGRFLNKIRGRVANGQRVAGRSDRNGISSWWVESADFAGRSVADRPVAS